MASASSPPHPYVPADLLLPDYVPVALSQLTIVGVYGISSLLVVSLVWILSGRCARLAKIDRLLMCWWAFTGLTHMVLEGYFVFSPEFFKEKTVCYLAEVWKEYSKGDSRYAGRDSAVVAVEGITAVLEGPACLLAVYAIAKKASYSYILQVSISLCQLYGTLVYFITSYLDGDNFATSPFYYYYYYVLANSFWVWIPSLIIIRNWKKICASSQVQTQAKTQSQKKSKTSTTSGSGDGSLGQVESFIFDACDMQFDSEALKLYAPKYRRGLRVIMILQVARDSRFFVPSRKDCLMASTQRLNNAGKNSVEKLELERWVDNT